MAGIASFASRTQALASNDPPSLVIENVAVVDVAQGRTTGPQTVVVVDRRIAAIGEPDEVAVPPASTRVDGRGRFLVPALVDMHVHLFNNASRRPPNEWAFPLFVANGVAGVREMAAAPTDLPTIARWRAAGVRGELIAPRVLAAGVPVRADSPEAARRRVREIKAAGADFVKVFSEVPAPHWRAILDEARALGIPVAGHVPAEIGVVEAAEAGQRSNEHLMQIPEASAPAGESLVAARRGLAGGETVRRRDAQEREILDGFDPRRCDQAATALARTKQAQVPTLVLPHFEARGDRAGFRDDPRWRLLRADEQARWAMILGHAPAEEMGLAARRWEVSREIVRALHDAGAPILAGTDAPMPLVYPGFSLHDELALLVESGLSPADALRAATLGPAEFLGLDGDRGAVAVGKYADLLLLDADPLLDIRHTRRIHAVVLDGRLLRRADLDALLEGAAKASAR